MKFDLKILLYSMQPAKEYHQADKAVTLFVKVVVSKTVIDCLGERVLC